MTWMPTWQHFLEVKLETCVVSWITQNVRLDSEPKSCKYICIKQSRSNFNDNWPYFSDYLRLTSWDFASMLGLGTMCELALSLKDLESLYKSNRWQYPLGEETLLVGLPSKVVISISLSIRACVETRCGPRCKCM